MAEQNKSATRVFLDYSRKDIEFARRIADALTSRGYQLWVDWESIPPSVDWMREIEKGIVEADVFLFLISPDSIRSKISEKQLEIVARNGKRLIPLIVRDIKADEAPQQIANLNWIFFRETDDFDVALERLITAISTDYEWLQVHRRLQVQALEWEQGGRDDGYLLRGKPLQDAELALAAAEIKTPPPTQLQMEYVSESRRKAGILGRLGVSRRQQKEAPSAETVETQSVQATEPMDDLSEIQLVEVGKLFSVSTDQASGTDQLNYARFADAFVTLIRNPEAKTPITIGIYGQWGSGKSFLMKKIIEGLKNDPSATPKSHRGNLKSLFERKLNPQVETIVIEFNAWVYSGSEHLWASLVTHLYREIERYFGVRAHYHRLIKAFRRFIPKTIGVFLFYAIPALLISLLIGFDNIQRSWETANIALKAVGVSVVGGSLLATLPVLWSALREFADTLFMSRAMNLQQLAAKPDFRDQIGIMADIKSEISFISHLLETRNKSQQTRIILFIDDLDRCEHRKAVEVLQAIMLLLADRDGSPFVIFLGIDARVIVRAVEEHYGEVLVKAGINGYEYLDKIVQMPFVIPSASRKDIGNYVDSLIWTKAEKDLVESKFASKLAESITAQPSQSTSGEDKMDQEVSVPVPAPQIKTEAVPVTFTKPEREALKRCVDDIVDNPRKIKRIVNIYRFVRLLLPSDFEQHEKIIRWILLTEQWPLHAAWIVEEIENDYFLQGKLSKKKNATIMDVYNQVKDNIYADDMDPLMTIDADPILFNQFIRKQPVFSVQDIYKLLYPLTFNLNPAIRSEISKYSARMAENYIQTKQQRKPRNHRNPKVVPETESATMKKAIQEISETHPQ